MKRTGLLCLLLVLPFGGAAIAVADDTGQLHDLFDRQWEWRLRENPLFASYVGRSDYNDRLPDVSVRALTRQADATRAFLNTLRQIDRAALSRGDQINYDIFERQLALRVADIEFGDYEMPINADSGFHTAFARLPRNVRFVSAADYDDYIARLNAFPVYVAAHIANMRAGLERGMTVPRVVLDGYEHTIAAHVVDDPEQSVFWAPFAKFPGSVPAEAQGRLRAAGAGAVMNGAVAGYKAFLDFMTAEYMPGARASLGAASLPDGDAYYRHKIRTYTTLDLSPRQIHEIGLGEVARIRTEMEAVIGEVAFEGSFEEFLAFLRTDERFYPKTADELLKEAAYIAKRMDGKLPSLFYRMPRQPYTVEPVPDYIAPKYTTGRYVGAPLGSTEPGRYWVNTYNLKMRPLYNLEALSLHEAVPGHHFQVALSRELEDVPEFRRHAYISAFGEGWGLYSEWLGLEAGFYTDPYSNFGRLTYEMWRACRLVVDTGVHAFGWTREQVLDYLASNTALPMHEVQTETDRYISWPGQALSYKLGELKIRELRRRAERELGERFDVRAFHDAVLANGSVPLTVLEESIREFIAQAR